MPLEAGLFQLMSSRLRWLGERQTVLGQNLANADTPDYVPHDLSERDFGRFVEQAARGSGRLTLIATDAGHLPPAPAAQASVLARAQDATFEVAPNGNAVVLEEQMAKVAETALDHRLTSNLYRKYLSMVRTALGRQG